MFPTEAERPSRVLLGMLLVEMGSITESQLRHALSEQEQNGQLLGEVLVANGYTSRLVIEKALAKQRGPSVELEHEYGTGLLAKLTDERSRERPTPRPVGYEVRELDPVAHHADEDAARTSRLEHRLEDHERRLAEIGCELDVLRDLLERASQAAAEQRPLGPPGGTAEPDFLVVVGRAKRHLAARRAALPSPPL